ncbi:MAG: hypothetical protein ISQ77_08500, partial [Candidatus Nanopelagicales bacterium]|nr:hypothetical protein [Candidatus Nanopelagicales bacterium]
VTCSKGRRDERWRRGIGSRNGRGRFVGITIRDVSVESVRGFIGLAGSVTTVAALAHGLTTYDAQQIHGSVTTRDQVGEVTDSLLKMSRTQRAALPVMHPGRIDVIGGGALVLRQILSRLPVSGVVASETDILDGIVYSLAAKSTPNG